MLYWLVTAMYPQFLITLDEKLEDKAVTVRVGQAVNTIGLAGTRSGISGVSDDVDVDGFRIAHLIWRVSQSTCHSSLVTIRLSFSLLRCHLTLVTPFYTLLTPHTTSHHLTPPHTTFTPPTNISTPVVHHTPLPSSNHTSA
jgi:hypothetical protein